jgi:hypothetical protein
MEGLQSLYFLVLLGNIFPSVVLAAKGVVPLDSLTFDKVCIRVFCFENTLNNVLTNRCCKFTKQWLTAKQRINF